MESIRDNHNEPESWGNPQDTVMVIGGGVAGMRAAVDLAEAGLQVCLVESTPAVPPCRARAMRSICPLSRASTCA